MTDHGTPVLVEQVSDSYGDHERQWYCQPPAEGVTYMVTDCTWTPDRKTRKIFAVAVGYGHEQR